MSAAECGLLRNEMVLFGSSYVALVAREPPQHPLCTVGHVWDGPSYDVQPPDLGEGLSDNGADVYHSPWTSHAAYERKESGIHCDGDLLCGA
jgi:hypothetical protein